MTSPARRGRPRDAAVDESVLRAAVERLSRDGYERTTIDDIAKDAGVTRPTVYRRWPSKEELVIAAVAGALTPSRREPTGDLREDLLHVAQSFQTVWSHNRYLGLLGTAIVERAHHPEIYACLSERLIKPRRDEIRHILQHGIDAGTVNATIDVDVVVSMLIGSYYALSIAEQWDEADDWAERVVETVLHLVRPLN